jgi:heme exporter protein A
MIETKRLVKRFGYKRVLRELDFYVDQGEFVAILGPNGAGKTTLLRILSTLSRPESGEVKISGYRLPSQSTSVRKLMGVVSHQPLLYGDLSAIENLKFFGRMYAIENIQHRIEEVLSIVGLEQRAQDIIRTYSRGMQQRLAIGRAILHDPSVLLLDEPHTGLDQEACEMLDQVLLDVASQGRTLVMTSHDLARSARLAWRFDILARGKIVASTTRAELEPDQLLHFYRQTLEAG